MTSNRPSGRPSSGGSVPPTSRRSARQQRLANREANRTINRAGTRGGGGSNGQILLYTVIAVVMAAVVVGGALLLTSGSKPKQPLGTPNPPVGSFITPTSVTASGRTLGNANAPHTIDIYEDFQCPNCWIFTHDIEPQIIANYVATGKAKLVYHDLLVIDYGTGGTESLDAANAARCAEDQGMFWPYHDWLFANQYSEGSGAFTKDRLKTIGQMVGIQDLTKFNSCVDNGTHNGDVQSESSGSGFNSTPTIVIDGGTPLDSYDYATVSAALDSALGISPSPSVGASASASASPAPSGSSAPSASVSASSAQSASASPATSPSAKPS
jgi:protein-disulfide isomerase